MRGAKPWWMLATREQLLVMVLMNWHEEKKTFCPATCAKIQPNCVRTPLRSEFPSNRRLLLIGAFRNRQVNAPADVPRVRHGPKDSSTAGFLGFPFDGADRLEEVGHRVDHHVGPAGAKLLISGL
jgi:hypothetical protein